MIEKVKEEEMIAIRNLEEEEEEEVEEVEKVEIDYLMMIDNLIYFHMGSIQCCRKPIIEYEIESL